MPAFLEPTTDFDRVTLETVQIGVGETYGRIVRNLHPDPLGYGKGPTRFSDPRPIPEEERFGVVYLGENLKICFVEALLRDQRDGIVGHLPIEMRELTDRSYAEFGFRGPLLMTDLREDGRLRMGIPSDVTNATDQSAGRAWSAAIYRHPMQCDGIVYRSRLNGQTNLAVFDRALDRLVLRQQEPLLRAKGLASVLNDLLIALI